MTTETDFTTYTGPVTTRNGDPVEIKLRDCRGKFPLRGYIGDSEGLSGWSSKGEWGLAGHPSGLDLIPAEPVVIEYQNQYSNGRATNWYRSKELVDKDAGHDRIGVLWRKRKGSNIIDAGVVGVREP